jgi:hypothetical protein
LTSSKKSDYRNHLDFLTKEQSELREILSSETTIARFLHLNESQEYLGKLNRTVRVLKMVLEIVDPFYGNPNLFYGIKIHLKKPFDKSSDRVLKVVRSDCMDDILYVLKLHKQHFKVPDNYKMEDLKEEWNKRLGVCEDLTKLGFSNNPANSMSKLFAFEPKTRKIDKKLNKMKRGLDRVFSNYNDAQEEMKRLNEKNDRNDQMKKEKEFIPKTEKKEEFIPESYNEEDEILNEKIENHLDEKSLFEHGLTVQKTGLDSKTIKLPTPHIDDKFINNSQLKKNKNFTKLKKNNYEKTMHTQRRNYPYQSMYKNDLSISKYKGKYNYQKGFYNGAKYKMSRKEDHYDLKARKPVIYSQLVKAADYCQIPKYNVERYIISPESIVKNLCPLLSKCQTKIIKGPKRMNWGLTDLQTLLYKLNQLPKDQIQLKAFVSTNPKDLPIIPNFDNRNPRPNKHGVVQQYQFKGVVQNAGSNYQNLKNSLLNNRYNPLKVNYSKI